MVNYNVTVIIQYATISRLSYREITKGRGPIRFSMKENKFSLDRNKMFFCFLDRRMIVNATIV